MSDQYVKLEEERRHRQRLEKDKRKRKKRERERRGARRHTSLHTESDEDITPAQRVDIVTEEMPEVGRGLACRAGALPRGGLHPGVGLPITAASMARGSLSQLCPVYCEQAAPALLPHYLC